jgi:putative RecB family exonuclease
MATVMESRSRAPAPAQRPPNLAAQNITGRPYLSHTQISTMRTCPRKFAFLYVEHAPPDFIPSSLIFGGAIHYALELYYRTKLEGLPAPHGGLMAAYSNAWDIQKAKTGADVPVRFNKDETRQSLDALADRIITSFLASPLANPKGVILGVEEELRVELDPDLPDLLAKVDLLTETDASLHVIDFKTSRSRWTDKKAVENAEQLLLYGTTMQSMSQGLGRPTKLHFAILTKAKTPVVQLLAVPTDKDRLAGLTESVRQVWQAIQAGNFYPSPSPMNCATCPFRSRCPAFSSGK